MTPSAPAAIRIRFARVPVLFLLGVWWLHDRHQVVGVELRQLAGVDPIGLGRQGREALDLHGVGDLDVPARLLERVMHEAGPVHRLHHRADRLAVAGQPLREGPEGVGVGPDGRDLHGRAVRIEHVHIQPLSRQVQPGI